MRQALSFYEELGDQRTQALCLQVARCCQQQQQ